MKYLLSVIFRFITSTRNYLFDIGVLGQYKSKLPVISVGNISVGGSGKTPNVILISSILRSKGFSPVILSRGYGGDFSGEVSLDDDPLKVGDEPLMMAKRLNIPVVVSKSRVNGAKLIEKKNLGDVIILDDGLQHRYLKRDLNLILIPIDSEDRIKDFLEDKILPLGTLRESRDSALKRGTAVILSARSIKSNVNLDHILSLIPESIPCYFSSISKVSILDSQGKDLSPQKIHAVSGIAHPESFINTLESMGFEIISHLSYPDHHCFPKTSIEEIRTASKKFPVVCTEKDWVKLGHIEGVSINRCIIENSITPLRGSSSFDSDLINDKALIRMNG